MRRLAVSPIGADPSLIMTLNRPIPVRVVVDDHDITTGRLRECRDRLGVVLQDNLLLDGTVAEHVVRARTTFGNGSRSRLMITR